MVKKKQRWSRVGDGNRSGWFTTLLLPVLSHFTASMFICISSSSSRDSHCLNRFKAQRTNTHGNQSHPAPNTHCLRNHIRVLFVDSMIPVSDNNCGRISICRVYIEFAREIINVIWWCCWNIIVDIDAIKKLNEQFQSFADRCTYHMHIAHAFTIDVDNVDCRCQDESSQQENRWQSLDNQIVCCRYQPLPLMTETQTESRIVHLNEFYFAS